MNVLTIIKMLLIIIDLFLILYLTIKIIKNKRVSYKELQKFIIIAILFFFITGLNYYNKDTKNENETIIFNYAIKEEKTYENTIFIGDSRTVGMFLAVNPQSYVNEIDLIENNEYWYASVGKGYSWFNNYAIYKLNDLLNQNNYKVIIELGANDLNTLGVQVLYIQKIYELALKFPNSKFVISNVGPIEDAISSYEVTNEDVIEYNEVLFNNYKLYNAENFEYLDLYTNIINDFKTTDGLHYNKNTYLKIYDLFINC